MQRSLQHRSSRRFLCVALSVSLFVVLIAAGWTEYSTTATAAGFALEIHGGVRTGSRASPPRRRPAKRLDAERLRGRHSLFFP